MAGSRTLKLSILGDVDNLNKSLKSAGQDVETFGDKVGKAGKIAGAALAAAATAAAAYAVKIGIDGVKAAIEDEKAQTQLALALENATGATKAQIAATEDYILKTSLATGVTDEELRPALQKLALSTNDLGKAQELLALAMDISAQTGKPLENVSQALGLAFDGNTAALGKLKLGLTAAELKTMSFEQAQSQLTDLFGGAAAANAETYSGRIARMQIAFDEAKETIGFALLPLLEKVMQFINQIATPAIEALNKGFSGESGLGWYISNVAKIIQSIFVPVWNGLISAFNDIKLAIGDNLDAFKEFGSYIATYLAPVIGTVLGGALTVVGKIAAGIIDIVASVIKVINGLVSGAIAGINALIRAYNAVPLLPNIPTITAPSLPNPSVSSSSVSLPTTSTVKVPTISGAGAGGGVTSAASGGSKAATAAVATPYSTALTKDAAIARAEKATGGTVISPTINIGVAGDPEGVARTVVDVLNRSYGRGALGAESLFV